MTEMYAVILHQKTPSVGQALESEYTAANVHTVAENVYLVQTGDDAGTVVQKAGIREATTDTEPIPGVVFSLNGSYSGLYFRSLWQWMGVKNA